MQEKVLHKSIIYFCKLFQWCGNSGCNESLLATPLNKSENAHVGGKFSLKSIDAFLDASIHLKLKYSIGLEITSIDQSDAIPFHFRLFCGIQRRVAQECGLVFDQ